MDPTLVSSITEALLKVMQQHSGAETKPLVEKSPKVSEKPVEVSFAIKIQFVKFQVFIENFVLCRPSRRMLE